MSEQHPEPDQPDQGDDTGQPDQTPEPPHTGTATGNLNTDTGSPLA